MPNEAFFHLEKAKKELLLQSAIAEFSALPYEKVSIFKIAQNAGVSRSGFYYYFKDKEDIYKYLTKQIRDEFTADLAAKGEKYDIFSFSKEIFRKICSIKGTEREAFFRQMVSNMKPDDTKEFFRRIDNCTSNESFQFLCDFEQLNISTGQELMGLACLLIGGTMHAVQRYLIGEECLEKAEERLDQMFEMIKYGVLK